MDRNELKVQALTERLAQLTAQYENQAADYRVEITILTQQLQESAKNGPQPDFVTDPLAEADEIVVPDGDVEESR